MTYPDSVKFHPFVGEKYFDSRYGVRVLVLGESHYSPDGWDDGLDFTQRVVNELAYAPGYVFFSKLTNILLGRTGYPTNEERREAWQHVAFYNYVQEFVADTARVAPTRTMWAAAQAPLVEVVRQLEPDVIIVLGSRLWNKVGELPPHFPVEWCSIIHPSSRMAYDLTFAAVAESIRKAGGRYN